MRATRRLLARQARLWPALLMACAAAVLAIIGAPFANSSFVATTTNSANTVASNGYFTCTAAVSDTTAGTAYFAYPFGESSGTAATDVSGNANTGLYTSSGITYGVANNTVCPRDKKTVITLDGANGYISGPNTSVNNPTVFTLEIWFKTTAAQGKLIGFGNARTGSSGQYDRHLYIDSTGKLEFGVYPGSVKTIATPAAVTDGTWHYAAATLSGAGMALYLDGRLVVSNTSVTTAENHAGYWRIGYDNINGWTNTPSSYYFKGSLAWAAVYNRALTADEIASHYRAGT